MTFRNFCVVIMGQDTKDALQIINKVTEGEPNFLDAKGILIATFSTFMELNELTDLFKSNNKNFLLFDLNEEYSSFNITKLNIHEGLFGFLNVVNDGYRENKTKNLLGEITGTTTEFKYVKPEFLDINKIDMMSAKEKDKLMNILIDKGIENLSEYDKEILDKLAV